MSGECPVRYKMMGGVEEMIEETESGGEGRGWVVSIQCSTLGGLEEKEGGGRGGRRAEGNGR